MKQSFKLYACALMSTAFIMSSLAVAVENGSAGGTASRNKIGNGTRSIATLETVKNGDQGGGTTGGTTGGNTTGGSTIIGTVIDPSPLPSPSPSVCTTQPVDPCPPPLTDKFECPTQWPHRSDGRIWCLHDAYHMGADGRNAVGEQFANNLLVCDYERLSTTYIGPDPTHPVSPMDKIATADCSGMTLPFDGSNAIATAGRVGSWCQSVTGHIPSGIHSGAPVYLSLGRDTTPGAHYVPPSGTQGSQAGANSNCPPQQPDPAPSTATNKGCPAPVTRPDVCPLTWSTQDGSRTWCLHDTYHMGSDGSNSLGEMFSPNLLVCDYERLNTTAIGPDPLHPTTGADRIAASACSSMELPFGGTPAGITSGGAGTWCQSYGGHIPTVGTLAGSNQGVVYPSAVVNNPVYLSLGADTTGSGITPVSTGTNLPGPASGVSQFTNSYLQNGPSALTASGVPQSTVVFSTGKVTYAPTDPNSAFNTKVVSMYPTDPYSTSIVNQQTALLQQQSNNNVSTQQSSGNTTTNQQQQNNNNTQVQQQQNNSNNFSLPH